MPLLLPGFSCARDPFDAEPFDARAWRGAPDANARGGMARDLIARHLKPGRARGEVAALLGGPNSETTTDGLESYLGRRPAGRDVCLYDLGRWGRLDFTGKHLYVCFDARGRLTTAGILDPD